MSRPPSVRQKRVADMIQAEMGNVLREEINDPRLGLVTVTRVNVDRELDYANIWVCGPPGEAEEAEVLAALDKAGGFLRYQVAQRMNLRKMPQLRFHWDVAPDAVDHMDALLDQVRAENSPDDAPRADEQ